MTYNKGYKGDGISEFKKTWNIPEKEPAKKQAKKKNRGLER